MPDRVPADLLTIAKQDYQDIICRMSVADSPVGIGAQYTQAIIVTYLRQMMGRPERIETRLGGG
jgi:hypothetical protein